MTIAIPARGEGWDAEVDDRFGRAKGFLLVDNDSGATRFVQNASHGDADHGAGIGAVQLLVNLGIHTLLANRVGPKAADALAAAGILCFPLAAQRTVAEAWQAYTHENPTL
ncbi:MAG: dinitrogenase iron-molybdenum cofactor biosynthesis protein [Bacteroidia bacterium]|nr:dinitrogenase iron-molybdenum cofactor biosynthesis protein [Bacteroidia bacterium]